MFVHAKIPLCDRERLFIYGLAEGLAPTRAAAAAGYSIGHTAALLKKPTVQAALLAFNQNTKTMLEVLEPSEEAE